MELQKQVANRLLAKTLKRLDIKQCSLWWWTEDNIDGSDTVLSDSVVRCDDYPMIASAFTSAELGELLPFYIVNIGALVIKKHYRRDLLTGWSCSYKKTINCTGKKTPTICSDTEANAKAQMIIYLLDNKLVSLEDVNAAKI